MEIQTREQWRADRLNKAFGIAAKVLDMDDAQLKALIHSLQDVNGHLVVSWRHPMSNSQARAFRVAWGLCGESEQNTSNRVFW